MPLLQAEKDRFLVNELKQRNEREQEIMKDVEGWEVGKSPYHFNEYFMPPLFSFETMKL